MKRQCLKILKISSLLMCGALVAIVVSSCELLGFASMKPDGELALAFATDQESLTRSGLEIPDTSDFILTVSDSKGKTIYNGAYGNAPESFSLNPGSYTVRVISEEFIKPAFSLPQFGDEQCVVVPAGKTMNVRLVCTQLNSGIRLKIDPAFLDCYPDGVLLLKSAQGRLVYGYSEKRVAYFRPGDVSLVLNEGKVDKVLMTRELKAREILDLKVGVASGKPSGQGGVMSIEVDTLRVWKSDEYVIGGDPGKGEGSYDALTVSEALSSVGEKGVWVCGHIVGGDLSSSSASFQKPFESRTNFLLGPRASTDDKEDCLSVQLPSGEIRNNLNLVDNPGLLGRKICIKGDIVEAYYGIPGIKNMTEYELM
ncbi:MAG: DUF4493 domain-containing protein [Bacteroidales bacterium]|nr:DUF4493 domain-containing protein [Bacteroidales bacterium]